MEFQFVEATKVRLKLRLALAGVAGAGKTWTALAIASRLAELEGGRVGVVDTEHSRARLYADLFPKFLHVDLTPPFSPDRYLAAIRAAEKAGVAVLVIDGLSHAWMGEGGVLEIVDEAAAASGKNDKFGSGWRKGTPAQNKLIEGILSAPMHTIATMRMKPEYSMDAQTRKVEKKGMGVVQRDNVDFEFDLVMEMEEAVGRITKSRYSPFTGRRFERPGGEIAEQLWDWLNSGEADSPASHMPAEEPSTHAVSSPPPPASRPAQPERSKTPMSQAQAVAAAGKPQGSDGSDLTAKDFIERADALGYKLPDGDHDYIRIAATLGLTPASEQKAAGLQIVKWHEQRGNTYRSALAKLADPLESPAATASSPNPEQRWQDRPATEPQIKAILAIGRGRHDMEDGSIGAWVQARFGAPLAELSRRQASEAIEALKRGTALPATTAAPADEEQLPFDPCPACGNKTVGPEGCTTCGWPAAEEAAPPIDVDQGQEPVLSGVGEVVGG